MKSKDILKITQKLIFYLFLFISTKIKIYFVLDK